MSRAILAALLLAVIAAPAAYADETKQIHELPFYVHQNLIDVPAGRDLAFYQGVIDQAIADANTLLQGVQGPFDSPCATEIVASGPLMTFSGASATPPQAPINLLFIDFAPDRPALQSIVGSGSGVFLVDFIQRCAAPPAPFPDPSNLPIGCASTPSCTGDADDDPDEITVLTIDALVAGALGQTLAHERGHNTCLLHGPTTDQCQIMRPAAGGGCLSTTECTSYQNGRNACVALQSGSQTLCEVSATLPASCVAATSCENGATLLGGNNAVAECIATQTTIEPDDSACSESGTSGFCSGGTCDQPASPTATQLMGSADPDFAVYLDTLGQQVYDARLSLSGKPGGWVDQGGWETGDEPQGLAYAPGRNIVYGVLPNTGGSDELIRIDPQTGATQSRTTISGRSDIIALAWDPGPTGDQGDDMLLGLESFQGFETLIEIDPDTGNSTTVAGLPFGCPTGNYSGLAYDSVNDELYTSSFCGLALLDCSNPNPFCALTELTQDNGVDADGTTLARIGSGLAYSAETGNIYMIGNQIGITIASSPPATGTFRVTNYNVLTGGSIRDEAGQSADLDFVEASETIGLEGLSIGGLAVVPAPEPTGGLLGGAALATLLGLARRRRLRSSEPRISRSLSDRSQR